MLRYDRTRDLAQLRAAWDSLCEHVDTCSFFHRPEWHLAVQEHLSREVTYHCFYDGGKLVAVFPLVTAGVGTRNRVLSMPQHENIFLADAVIDDRYVSCRWSELLLANACLEADRRVRWMRFRLVRSRSCIRAAIPNQDRRSRYVQVGGSTYCDCSDRSALSRLSSKHLRNIDRLQRKAHREIGYVEHVSYIGAAAAVAGFERFLEVEAASWKGPRGSATSISCVPQSKAFFRSVLENFSEGGAARVDLLVIGGVPAAANLALQCGQTLSLLKIGFDDAFSHFGPGNILLKLLVEQMAAGSDVCELSLVTAPRWAVRWHMETEPTYEMLLFSHAPSGLVRGLLHDTAMAARRLKARVAESRRA